MMRYTFTIETRKREHLILRHAWDCNVQPATFVHTDTIGVYWSLSAAKRALAKHTAKAQEAGEMKRTND